MACACSCVEIKCINDLKNVSDISELSLKKTRRQDHDLIEFGVFFNNELHDIDGYRATLNHPYMVEQGSFVAGKLCGQGIRSIYRVKKPVHHELDGNTYKFRLEDQIKHQVALSKGTAELMLYQEESGIFREGNLHGSNGMIRYFLNPNGIPLTIQGEFKDGFPWDCETFASESEQNVQPLSYFRFPALENVVGWNNPNFAFRDEMASWKIGTFKDGLLEGPGHTITFPGPSIESGYFEKGQLNGIGTKWDVTLGIAMNMDCKVNLPDFVALCMNEMLYQRVVSVVRTDALFINGKTRGLTLRRDAKEIQIYPAVEHVPMDYLGFYQNGYQYWKYWIRLWIQSFHQDFSSTEIKDWSCAEFEKDVAPFISSPILMLLYFTQVADSEQLAQWMGVTKTSAKMFCQILKLCMCSVFIRSSPTK